MLIMLETWRKRSDCSVNLLHSYLYSVLKMGFPNIKHASLQETSRNASSCNVCITVRSLCSILPPDTNKQKGSKLPRDSGSWEGAGWVVKLSCVSVYTQQQL